MTTTPRLAPRVLATLVLMAASTVLFASEPRSTAATIDETVPPGNNFDKAEFRLWLPGDVRTVRAALILVPGSNGDGRPMADDAGWQAFATKNKLALVGVRFTDKPHEQSFIEHYVNVSQGSGQALLTALETFAERSKHPELASAPVIVG